MTNEQRLALLNMMLELQPTIWQVSENIDMIFHYKVDAIDIAKLYPYEFQYYFEPETEDWNPVTVVTIKLED